MPLVSIQNADCYAASLPNLYSQQETGNVCRNHFSENKDCIHMSAFLFSLEHFYKTRILVQETNASALQNLRADNFSTNDREP